MKAGMSVFFRKRKLKRNESVWFEATIIKIKVPDTTADVSEWASACVSWLPAGGCVMSDGDHIWLEKSEKAESYTWQESFFTPSQVDVTCETVQHEDRSFHVIEEVVPNSYQKIVPKRKKKRGKKK